MPHAYVRKKCEQCQKTFEVAQSNLLRGRGKYCCKSCMYEARSQIMSGKCPKYVWGKLSKKHKG